MKMALALFASINKGSGYVFACTPLIFCGKK